MLGFVLIGQLVWWPLLRTRIKFGYWMRDWDDYAGPALIRLVNHNRAFTDRARDFGPAFVTAQSLSLRGVVEVGAAGDIAICVPGRFWGKPDINRLTKPAASLARHKHRD